MSAKIEVNAWKKLAASEVLENRLLALELAAELSDQIQPELLYWFSSNQAWDFKQRIFILLNSANQTIAKELGPKGKLSQLGGEGNFKYYLAADSTEEREAILQMEAEGHDLRQSKMLFYRYLQERTGATIKECRAQLIEILAKARK